MSKKIDLGVFNASENNNKNKDKNKPLSTTLGNSSNLNQQINNDNRTSYAPIDLSHTQANSFNKSAKKIKKRFWKRPSCIIFFIFTLVFILAGIFLGSKAFSILNDLKSGGIDVSFGDVIGNIINKPQDPQLTKVGNLTNTLIVGVDTRSGSGDSGLENTDSIMIASYNYDTHKVNIISIPRDNAVIFRVGKDNKTLIKGQRINAAYAIAQNYNYPGGGLALLRAALTEMTGLEINYTAQINFRAFKDVIDRVGGIDVDVERSFTDYEYPNDTDTGLITVSFKKGMQHMDGVKALQYARSRHSMDNGEGSDYARARRQQKVLVAVQEKLKKTNFVTDPNALSDFVKIFGNNVKIEETDSSASPSRNIDMNDISAILSLKDKADTKNVANVVLDPNIGGLNNIIEKISDVPFLIGPTLGLGKNDDIKKYVNFVINNPDLYNENKPGNDPSTNKPYGAQIGMVDNGYGYSNTVKEASKVSKDFLSAEYMAVLKSPLLNKDGVSKLSGVAIYDVTHSKNATKDYLMKKYNAQEVDASQIPDVLSKITKGYDLVVIFTKDYTAQ